MEIVEKIKKNYIISGIFFCIILILIGGLLLFSQNLNQKKNKQTKNTVPLFEVLVSAPSTFRVTSDVKKPENIHEIFLTFKIKNNSDIPYSNKGIVIPNNGLGGFIDSSSAIYDATATKYAGANYFGINSLDPGVTIATVSAYALRKGTFEIKGILWGSEGKITESNTITISAE